MTAPEAKAKLEAWRDLLKAKLEGVTPGPWWMDFDHSEKIMRVGVEAEKSPTHPHYVFFAPDTKEVDQENSHFVALSRSAVPAMLAGIKAVLKNWEGIKEWDGCGDAHDQGKCDGAKEDVIALAEAYEPHFQEVQS